MAECPTDYDHNSYEVYELELLYRLNRLFLFIFSFHVKIYVISNNICILQLMGVIACAVIKMI